MTPTAGAVRQPDNAIRWAAPETSRFLVEQSLLPVPAMFRLASLITGLGTALLAASTVRAQPVVTTLPITSPDAINVNIEGILESDEGNAIRMDWTSTFASNLAHRYEISYDRAFNPDNNDPIDLVDLSDAGQDAGENNGRAISGQSYFIRMTRRSIAQAAMQDMGPACSSPADTSGCPEGFICVNNCDRQIVVRVFPSSGATNQNSGTNNWTFRVDTVPPPAPQLLELIPGENRLTVRWERLTGSLLPAAEEILFYQIEYCVATSSAADGFPGYEPPEEPDTVPATPGHLPCDSPRVVGRIGESVSSFAIDSGLANGLPTAVAVKAIDILENEGPLSNVLIEEPIPVTDFFELHRELGGEEEGGFCFVATAAYGSDRHPIVRVLRAFRDDVLSSTESGRQLIETYYRVSPPWARWLAASDARRVAAQIALVPVALIAGLALLWPLFAAALVVILLRWAVRRRSRAGALVLLVAVAQPSAAEAKKRGLRPESNLPIGLGFEFKVGPYFPRMGDDDFDNGAFRLSFGRYREDSDGNATNELVAGPGSNPAFNFGTELQLWRGYGAATAYASVGFARWQGDGLDSSGAPTEDTTTLNIIPTTFQIGYRADFIVDYSPVPLVPYVRGGLAYYWYWVTDASGAVSRVENPDGDDFFGRGGKFGVTGTLGIQLLLNAIDRKSAQNFYNSTGVRGTYLFFEGTISNVDGFGQQGFDFSDTTWNAGLFIEL